MRSVRRAASETAAPAFAQASAVASPIPEEAPVIATTRPLRSRVHAPSLSRRLLIPRTGDSDRRLPRVLEALFPPLRRVLSHVWLGILGWRAKQVRLCSTSNEHR